MCTPGTRLTHPSLFVDGTDLSLAKSCTHNEISYVKVCSGVSGVRSLCMHKCACCENNARAHTHAYRLFIANAFVHNKSTHSFDLCPGPTEHVSSGRVGSIATANKHNYLNAAAASSTCRAVLPI